MLNADSLSLLCHSSFAATCSKNARSDLHSKQLAMFACPPCGPPASTPPALKKLQAAVSCVDDYNATPKQRVESICVLEDEGGCAARCPPPPTTAQPLLLRLTFFTTPATRAPQPPMARPATCSSQGPWRRWCARCVRGGPPAATGQLTQRQRRGGPRGGRAAQVNACPGQLLLPICIPSRPPAPAAPPWVQPPPCGGHGAGLHCSGPGHSGQL